MSKKRRLSDAQKRDYADELEELLLYGDEERFKELYLIWGLPTDKSSWEEALNEFRKARDAKRGLLPPRRRT